MQKEQWSRALLYARLMKVREGSPRAEDQKNFYSNVLQLIRGPQYTTFIYIIKN